MNREQFISHTEGVQRELRRFLTALCCGDRQLADDIAQESLIKAYLSCEGFREEAKFSSWIFRIAYNTFLNHRRDERRTVDYDEAPDTPGDDTADSSFRYQELYAALNGLPPKERTALLLHYLEGYSVREISEIVEASEAAVKQHLSRGRNHLREVLNNT